MIIKKKRKETKEKRIGKEDRWVRKVRREEEEKKTFYYIEKRRLNNTQIDWVFSFGLDLFISIFKWFRW
jgi:hypothetical protein